MSAPVCDGCKWCQSHSCNEHENFAVWHPIEAQAKAVSSDGLREALRETLEWIDRHEEALGHSYCDLNVGGGWASDECTCGFDERRQRWRIALAAPAPAVGLDIERLARAMYTINNRQRGVALEDVAAKDIATEYARLVKDTGETT